MMSFNSLLNIYHQLHRNTFFEIDATDREELNGLIDDISNNLKTK